MSAARTRAPAAHAAPSAGTKRNAKPSPLAPSTASQLEAPPTLSTASAVVPSRYSAAPPPEYSTSARTSATAPPLGLESASHS